MAILRQNGGFDEEKPLVLAVSGGVDSLVLTHALKGFELKLIVAHLDHALRAISAQQAEALGRMMSDWGLPFISRRMDVNAFSEQEKLGIEEAARLCRYRFLYDVARAHDAQAIVLGHNADDQVETVLMHFMRGSGMAGLTGMAPFTVLKQFDPTLPLLRPLLGIHRCDIESYAKAHSLTPLEDESNHQVVYYRNRLRHQIIPELEKLNPGFRQSALRAAEVLRGDEQLLLSLEEQAYCASVIQTSQDEIVLDRETILGLDLALQRRVVRRCLNQLRVVNPDFGFRDIEKVRGLIAEGHGALDISSGLQVLIVGKDAHLLNQNARPEILSYPQLPSPETRLYLKPGETVFLNAGWQLSARLMDAESYALLPEGLRQDSRQAFVPAAGVHWPLEVRSPQTGDRWAPLGLENGSQKISDFFVNNKIPQATRAAWPIVLSGGSVVWLTGLRLAHDWRLRGGEQEILHLSLQNARS